MTRVRSRQLVEPAFGEQECLEEVDEECEEFEDGDQTIHQLKAVKGLKELREMAEDLQDFAEISTLTSSIRRLFQSLDRVERKESETMNLCQALSSVSGEAHGSSSSEFFEESPVGSHPEGLERQGSELRQAAVDESYTDLIVALRVRGLLNVSFDEALEHFPMLRAHINEQVDPYTVEDEFRRHWHPDAPAELRDVLELLCEEATSMDSGTKDMCLPSGSQAQVDRQGWTLPWMKPPRARL
eukprot:CAMPEP_0117526804 /NCGR_PEP_ID=MMETSP0784-20121206/36473_1 /TAXON_ID=39447 /ORGANISM="" /LENGTH=241 /DNA_ID=CAMNT_0005323041 /DNA_START=61 /DNA_END=786 /DNA_ORIENTATION=-